MTTVMDSWREFFAEVRLYRKRVKSAPVWCRESIKDAGPKAPGTLHVQMSCDCGQMAFAQDVDSPTAPVRIIATQKFAEDHGFTVSPVW